MRPKLPLVTLVIGPLKNCGELKALMKSVRNSRSKRSLIRLCLMTEISTLWIPGKRTQARPEDHVCNVSGYRIVHATGSFGRQSSVVPFANIAHVLNHCVREGLGSAGLTPVGAAPDGKFMGMPACRGVSVENSHPLTA
jgi:hypothetical protein